AWSFPPFLAASTSSGVVAVAAGAQLREGEANKPAAAILEALSTWRLENRRSVIVSSWVGAGHFAGRDAPRGRAYRAERRKILLILMGDCASASRGPRRLSLTPRTVCCTAP